ncbi:MAG: hypothetical protein KME49_28415 [Brasilonema octagenarum HA4186-MV1]|jgi:hypothetical protein|uniref:hypothetical protein n=1 Tax=Brasilonema octagenarum TaxID=417105 RepID=UPI00145FCAFD|nr:hypothetical protein [Brasilonema octagenarum]MBW4629329.1 hypothetical protein [Brasilonema octagenarum HA4186-MV1]
MENQKAKKDPESQVTSEADDVKKQIDLEKKELKRSLENEAVPDTEGEFDSPSKDRGP